MGGINLATKTFTDLGRKAHESLQWPVMDRHVLYNAHVVSGQDRDAEKFVAAERLHFPFEILT
jgi:hypothetical protein